MYKLLYNIPMKVGVFCNKAAQRCASVQKNLLDLLRSRGIAHETYETVDEIGDVEVLVVLGGDGTILKVAIEAGKRGIDLLGINAGNLGFLTQFEGEQTEAAVDLLLRSFETEERSVLEVQVGQKKYYALNDALFQRCYSDEADNNVVTIAAEIDGKKVDEFVGDGIIVSTPTGSTAYSLSAGGSVLTPDLSAFILTPVCAHSLHNRPIVYNDSHTMQVLHGGESGGLSLYCDGRHVCDPQEGEQIFLRRAPFSVRFVKREDSNFFDKLLFKLNKWSR